MIPPEARQLGLRRSTTRTSQVSRKTPNRSNRCGGKLCRMALVPPVRSFVLASIRGQPRRGPVAALARCRKALLATAPNLLVITSGIQATLVEWQRRASCTLCRDRIAQTEVSCEAQSVQGREATGAHPAGANYLPPSESDAGNQVREEEYYPARPCVGLERNRGKSQSRPDPRDGSATPAKAGSPEAQQVAFANSAANLAEGMGDGRRCAPPNRPVRVDGKKRHVSPRSIARCWSDQLIASAPAEGGAGSLSTDADR